MAHYSTFAEFSAMLHSPSNWAVRFKALTGIPVSFAGNDACVFTANCGRDGSLQGGTLFVFGPQQNSSLIWFLAHTLWDTNREQSLLVWNTCVLPELARPGDPEDARAFAKKYGVPDSIRVRVVPKRWDVRDCEKFVQVYDCETHEVFRHMLIACQAGQEW